MTWADVLVANQLNVASVETDLQSLLLSKNPSLSSPHIPAPIAKLTIPFSLGLEVWLLINHHFELTIFEKNILLNNHEKMLKCIPCWKFFTF